MGGASVRTAGARLYGDGLIRRDYNTTISGRREHDQRNRGDTGTRFQYDRHYSPLRPAGALTARRLMGLEAVDEGGHTLSTASWG